MPADAYDSSETLAQREQRADQQRTVLDTTETACCIAGAGPAGAMLALLLARAGISVVLLEEHMDFDRDFRGDTIHPSVMENLREIGLDLAILDLPHTEMHALSIQTDEGPLTVGDFGTLKTSYPFVTFMPQKRFLERITAEAARYPHFRLVLGARVEDLVREGDGEGSVVRGVVYRGQDGWHEARALLTVGCDGRFSRLRRLGGFTPITTSPPMDVLWFRLPRLASEPSDVMARIGSGRFLILLNRDTQWQVAAVIPKGSYQELRARGIEALHAMVTSAAPELADRMAAITDWKQVSLLSVAADRLAQWYKPGLLLIGDAAHTMSPVGGVGINYAIQDAVVAANVLHQPLRDGRVETQQLAEVQRQRELPTRIIQAVQTRAQRQAIRFVLDTRGALHVPRLVRLAVRIPGVRAIAPRLIGIGFFPAHVAPELRAPTATKIVSRV